MNYYDLSSLLTTAANVLYKQLKWPGQRMLLVIIEMFPEEIVAKVINLHLHFTDNDKIIIINL